MSGMSDTGQTSCQRCGTCCTRGGPALHLEDFDLVGKVLHTRQLMTLRRGELAHDPVRGGVFPLEDELIKIRGRNPRLGDWTCLLYRDTDRDGEGGCSIYATRPAECRILACWDTEALAAMYEEHRLTRAHVLPEGGWLMHLVQEHESRCGYGLLMPLARAVAEGDGLDTDAAEAFAAAVRYDEALRGLVVEKAGVDREELLFLFGRPLAETAPGMGLTLVRKNGDIQILPGAKPEGISLV